MKKVKVDRQVDKKVNRNYFDFENVKNTEDTMSKFQ
jgi:hypothetical protein